MGRFVYESPRVAATGRSRGGGIAGTARCRVYVMSPEENAFGADFPGSMRSLRARLLEDGSFLASPPAPALHAEHVVIPREVFDGLADAALVNLQWDFQPGSCEVAPKHE